MTADMIKNRSRETPPRPAPQKKLRFFWLWIALGVAMILAVILLSLAPPQDLPDISSALSDKVNHLLAYAALMFWFGQLFRKRGSSFVIAAGFVALGVALEFAQDSTGYRTFEYRDMAANGIGVICGLFLSRSRLGRLLTAFESVLPGRSGPRSSDEKH